jgi:hypothetical protein|nr:MAG TPA: hypothetical protein [Caudoviricetes sp.]
MQVFKYVIAVFVLGLFVTISSCSYEDELDSQTRYCKDVADGLHPDYLGTFDKECK